MAMHGPAILCNGSPEGGRGIPSGAHPHVETNTGTSIGLRDVSPDETMYAELMLVSQAVFACHSAACRPPTSGGTGGSLPFSSTVASWERDRPWLGSKDDFVSGRWGIGFKRARLSETASYEGGRVMVTEDWLSKPEGLRRAILYHEAGHALETQAGVKGLLRAGIDDPLGMIDWPGARSLGHNYSEVIAEAYSALHSDPEWFDRMKAHKIKEAVTALARQEGFPVP